MKKLSILAAVAAVLGVGGLTFSTVGAPAPARAGFMSQEPTQEEPAPAQESPSGSVQPIDFPHNTHAGTYQMDCMYCHFSAERSVDAGIPAVQDCMGCHLLVAGENNPEEVEKLRGYATRGEPIPWVRIYKISDHAHFPHMRHINAGLACEGCHGDVKEMGAIEERDPAWGGANMGWCVSCHIEQEVRRDCTVCHY